MTAGTRSDSLGNVGTTTYYTDADGHRIELSAHEGYVENELVDEFTKIDAQGPFTYSDYDPETTSHWTSTYSNGIPEFTGRYRPACDCGWRGDIFDANIPNPWYLGIFVEGKADILPDEAEDHLLERWHADHVQPIIDLALDLDPIAQADHDARDAQDRLRTAVAGARQAGRSWSEIAAKLRVTKQAAWERFQDLDR